MKRFFTIGIALLLLTVVSVSAFAEPTTWGKLRRVYGPEQIQKIDQGRTATPQAIRTTGYQAYQTRWDWDSKGPHFCLDFYIPHSTYSIRRYAGISTSGYDGGINAWDDGRVNLGNGWDRYTILVPKTLRWNYWYINAWDFSRYFWVWCTYNG